MVIVKENDANLNRFKSWLFCGRIMFHNVLMIGISLISLFKWGTTPLSTGRCMWNLNHQNIKKIIDERMGTVSIKIDPVPKLYYILNEILQPYIGFRTVLFSLLSLPVFLSLMVKLCVIFAKYWQRYDNVALNIL